MAEKIYYEAFDAVYVKNYDADTITVNIPHVPLIIGENMPIRVNGIDTPEMHSKSQAERDLAIQGHDFVHDLLSKYPKVHLYNCKRGKYFRIVADIACGEKCEHNLSALLLERKYALPYDGGTKPDWSFLDDNA